MNRKVMMAGKVKKAFFIGLGIHTGQGRHLVFIGPGRGKGLLKSIFYKSFRSPPFAAYANINILRDQSHKRLVHMHFFIGNDDASPEILLRKV